MDCNKDEAKRALDLAQKKMEAKDFVGAKKFILKAQKLFPDIDYIPHMLAVCEVHCSSGVTGLEDWYGILQVEVTADEVSIKKQYRKLALRLHPDKNKYAGAEAAFKLIEEAHRTLSDCSKRSFYDLKRRPGTLRSQPPSQHQSRKPPVKVQRGAPNIVNHSTVPTASNKPWQHKGSQETASETFWTVCPFCGIKYQYYLPILNKNIRCPTCQTPFIAYDMNSRGTTVRMHQNKTNAEFQNTFGSNSRDKPKEPEGAHNFGNEPKEKVQVNNHATKENTVRFENVILRDLNKKEKASVYPDNQKGKRKKTVLSDTESSDEEVIIKEANCNEHGDTVNHKPRRSARQKQDITYNENHTDDEGEYEDRDITTPQKRPKVDGSSHHAGMTAFSKSEMKPTDENIAFEGNAFDESGNHKGNSAKCEKETVKKDLSDSEINKDSDTDSSESRFISYCETEFCDFGKIRAFSVFSKNQIWALYDDLDGMPRFYAHIKSVSDFTIKYTWLEQLPVGKDQEEWSKGQLPVGCGYYKLDSEVDTSEVSLFSHIVSLNCGSRKKTYTIFPRKGEVWALYKDWDINWSKDPEKHKSYSYEIVEILSDYTQVAGIEVVPMIMVKGFVSLFTRMINEKSCLLHIQPEEILRFSHMVPSYKTTGEEKKGIPSGSYELDTASIPANFEDVFPSASYDEINARVDDKNNDLHKHLKVETKTGMCSQTSSILKHNGIGVECCLMHVDVSQEKVRKKSQMDKERNQMYSSAETGSSNAEIITSRIDSPMYSSSETRSSNAEIKTSRIDSPDTCSFTYEDAEFYNFDSQRSINKICPGQIWSLYREGVGFPNYYAIVMEVEVAPLKVHLNWLDFYPTSKEEKQWCKKEVPIGCGKFKVLSGKKNSVTFDTLDAFSHEVVSTSGPKNYCFIYPEVCQVWAIYRNWSFDWDTFKSDQIVYHIVEIISKSNSAIEAILLEKVKGHNTVFRQKTDMNGTSTMAISHCDYLCFSHCIPCFQLTNESEGKLCGYWELDPASVPETLACSN